eukprot:15431268-Alexandrium_andersonii.AAC.1
MANPTTVSGSNFAIHVSSACATCDVRLLLPAASWDGDELLRPTEEEMRAEEMLQEMGLQGNSLGVGPASYHVSLSRHCGAYQFGDSHSFWP